MNVSFTGTRDGMTPAQERSFIELIEVFEPPMTLLHGKCLGADEEAAAIASENGWTTRAFPSDMADWTSPFLSDIEHDPAPPLDRNRKIVDEGTFLIATPKELVEPQPARGQSTWSTIRYARKSGKDVSIIWPDGRVEASHIKEGIGTST